MELNKLYTSDCIELVKQFPEKFISHVITSPPYNIGRNYPGYRDTQKRNDFIFWQLDLIKHIELKMKENGLILYNFSYGKNDPLLPYSLIEEINRYTPFTIVDTIVWKKPNAIPFNINRLSRICEFVYVLCRKTEVDTFRLNINHRNYIEAANDDRIGRNYNQSTYSTELVLKLMKMYCDKDSVVFDPFSGIGTTIRACNIFGCSWIGSEKDWHQTNYFTNKRLPAIIHKLDELKEQYKNILE